MKFRKNNIFVKLKLIIRLSNMIAHSFWNKCSFLYCVVLINVEKKLNAFENDSNWFWKGKKMDLPLSAFGLVA
jgi:hypothetical protein